MKRDMSSRCLLATVTASPKTSSPFLSVIRPERVNDCDLALNHAHVPASDAAMDRAKFYTSDEVVGLTVGDVATVKGVLRSGRCAEPKLGTQALN